MSDDAMLFIDPWKKFGGILVPGWILARTEIGPEAKLLYSLLTFLTSDQDEEREVDTFEIVTEWGFKQENLSQGLKQLSQQDLIEVLVNDNGKLRFGFYYHSWMDCYVDEDGEAVA